MKLAKTAAIAAATLLIGCSDAQEGKVNGGQIDATTADASVGYDASPETTLGPETMIGDISAPDASTTEVDTADAVESPALATRAYLAQRVYEVLIGDNADCPKLAEEVFTDVSADHPNSEAINCLHEMKIVNGYANGSFEPATHILKAETAHLLYKTLAKLFTVVDETQPSGTEYFDDVSPQEWYEAAVTILVDMGIIPHPNESGNTNYNPADATTEDFLEMLLERACDKGYCAN